MKGSIRIWLLVVGVATSALAAEEKLQSLSVGSEVYSNVTVTTVTATHIYFDHSRGLGSARLRDLDAALQSHFHFNAALGATLDAQQGQANGLYSKALRDAPPPKRPVEPEPEPEPAPRQIQPKEVPPHRLYAKSIINQAAPALTVEKWVTEPPATQGKFVLVDFWATWCGPCRRSIPLLNAFQERFKDRLVVIGISDETEEVIRRMVNPKIGYAVATDQQKRMKHTLQVKGIPHAILIDPSGVVRFEGMPDFLDEDSLGTLLARF